MGPGPVRTVRCTLCIVSNTETDGRENEDSKSYKFFLFVKILGK